MLDRRGRLDLPRRAARARLRARRRPPVPGPRRAAPSPREVTAPIGRGRARRRRASSTRSSRRPAARCARRALPGHRRAPVQPAAQDGAVARTDVQRRALLTELAAACRHDGRRGRDQREVALPVARTCWPACASSGVRLVAGSDAHRVATSAAGRYLDELATGVDAPRRVMIDAFDRDRAVGAESARPARARCRTWSPCCRYLFAALHRYRDHYDDDEPIRPGCRASRCSSRPGTRSRSCASASTG